LQYAENLFLFPTFHAKSILCL